MSISVDIRKRLATFELDVAFEVGQETLGLLGASGCGKSMTMRCIAGVEHPDEGRIVVNGETFFDSDKHIDLSPQKRKTALLFQNFQLFPNLTVGQNVAAGIGKDVPDDEREATVDAQLVRFGLEGFKHRYPMRLSGGQQQRVALARMLAAHPGILMLDEPFSALDAHLKMQLEQDLLELFEGFGGSILYVSHDIDEAFRFCDRIAVMDQGKLCEIDDTANIVQSPKTLATIKLSGCPNTSRARKVDAHTFEALDWGITLGTIGLVPDDIEYVGVRSFDITPARDRTRNVVSCVVDRTSDSRFKRMVVLIPQGEGEATAKIQWEVDKLHTLESTLPKRGDVLQLYFDPNNIYMVKR